tara:strand:- start:3965 stop:4870 length:906 start_codon:yes stop_codon:yes gene_type:complete
MTSKKLNICLIGCVKSSDIAFNTLLENTKINFNLLICSKKSTFNSDFVDLGEKAKKKKIEFIYEENIKDFNAQKIILDNHKIDLVFVIGWSKIIKEPILSSYKNKIIGFHPAELPKNRGRHPIIWALVLGLKKTASTFFFLTKEPDAGDILNQKIIKISNKDYAKDLYDKVLKAIPEQINEIIDDFLHDSLNPVRQVKKDSNVWRKRGEIDGKIDWRMNSKNIYNLIRALADPYPGAYFIYNKKKFLVSSSKIVNLKIDNQEPGRIIRNNSKELIVKTGDKAISFSKNQFKDKIEGEFFYE